MVFGPYPAIVTGIHDGDTISLDTDLGFGTHQVSLRCRLWAINAPELSTDAGKIAQIFAIQMCPVGTKVNVISHGWDAYGGRFDGEVKLPDGSDFATRMVDSGNAIWKKYS